MYRYSGLPAAIGNPFQFARQVARALPALLGRFGETFLDGVIQSRRNQGLKAGDRNRFFFEDGGSNAELALTEEGALSGEHFVEDRAEGENVAAAVELFAYDLLW